MQFGKGWGGWEENAECHVQEWKPACEHNRQRKWKACHQNWIQFNQVTSQKETPVQAKSTPCCQTLHYMQTSVYSHVLSLMLCLPHVKNVLQKFTLTFDLKIDIAKTFVNVMIFLRFFGLPPYSVMGYLISCHSLLFAFFFTLLQWRQNLFV